MEFPDFKNNKFAWYWKLLYIILSLCVGIISVFFLFSDFIRNTRQDLGTLVLAIIFSLSFLFTFFVGKWVSGLVSLSKPAWQSRNEEKALAAVEKITNQKKLVKIYKEAPLGSVREKVGKKINQSIFIELAKNDTDKRVRANAVCHITDQSILIEFAKNDSYELVRRYAVQKITDQSILIRCAKSDSDKNVREEAVERITNQSILLELAKNDSDERVRVLAVCRITDQLILLELVRNNTDKRVRVAAVNRVTDQSILLELAKNDRDIDARIAALERITDKTVLNELAEYCAENYARNYENYQVLIKSVERIKRRGLQLDQSVESVIKRINSERCKNEGHIWSYFKVVDGQLKDCSKYESGAIRARGPCERCGYVDQELDRPYDNT